MNVCPHTQQVSSAQHFGNWSRGRVRDGKTDMCVRQVRPAPTGQGISVRVAAIEKAENQKCKWTGRQGHAQSWKQDGRDSGRRGATSPRSWGTLTGPEDVVIQDTHRVGLAKFCWSQLGVTVSAVRTANPRLLSCCTWMDGSARCLYLALLSELSERTFLKFWSGRLLVFLGSREEILQVAVQGAGRRG